MYDEVIKKVNEVDSNKKILKKMIEDVDKKIPDASKLTETHIFNEMIKKDQKEMQEWKKHLAITLLIKIRYMMRLI